MKLTENWESVRKILGNREIISDRDLIRAFLRISPDINMRTLRWRIFELKRQGALSKVGKDLYVLGPEKSFAPLISKSLVRINNRIKDRFPYVKFCVWETKWLNNFMVHQVAGNSILVEVEKEAMAAAFAEFHGGTRESFLNPTAKETQTYLLGEEEKLVVRSFVQKGPTRTQDNVPIPKLEKILLDLLVEPDFFVAYQGEELGNIFENAFAHYRLNITTMMSYAKRRGSPEELRSFLTHKVRLPEYAAAALGTLRIGHD